MGYTATNFYHDTPIEDRYDDQFIKGKHIKTIKIIDPDCRRWEDMGIRCKTQEESKIKYVICLIPKNIGMISFDMESNVKK